MRPHYLIDGYNVIHKIPELKSALNESLEKSRNLLIHRILNYQASKKIDVTLVFDGADVGVVPNPYQNKKHFHVYFSHSPEKADPLIMKIIRDKGRNAQFILVSADKELINCARSFGLQSMHPSNFYHLIRKDIRIEQLDQKFDQPLNDEQLKEWLKIFGEEEEQ